MTNGYWFNGLKLILNKDKIPANLNAKVTAVNPDVKGSSRTYELNNGENNIGFTDDEKPYPHSSISTISVQMDKSVWDQSKFDIKDFMSLTATVNDFAEGMHYYTTSQLGKGALQDMALVPKGGVVSEVKVPLRHNEEIIRNNYMLKIIYITIIIK